MTRFQRELSGELGAYWKRQAEQELERVRRELGSGEITIDENGVARNCIGRVVMDDLLEKLEMVSDVSAAATQAAREAEDAAFLAEYRARRSTPGPEELAETLAEMRAAFGAGAEVVNVLTGEKIKL